MNKEKIFTKEALWPILPKDGLVMCHGVFDLVHPGHIAHLEEAKAQGNWLLVSVTSDRWVRANKGEGHPVFGEEARAKQLASLEVVDYVVIDDNPDPREVISYLTPNVYCKGPDYIISGDYDAKLKKYEIPVLESYGGKLYITGGKVVCSSSNLHKKLDVGKYHKDPKGYAELVERTYSENPAVELPAEFSRCITNDLLMLTIRLARYKFAAKMLSKEDTVLEVGSGYGLGAIFLGQFCRSVHGVDVQLGAVEEARRLNKRSNVSFECGDFLGMDFSLRKYDTIAVMDVIEHMDEVQAHRLLSKVSKRLLKNGMMVLGTPSVYSESFQSNFSKLSHVHCYDKEELIELVKGYFNRAICFSMNDEVVHTGFHKLAWYYFVLAFNPIEE